MIKGKSKILITGGAGYIGSHTCVELLESGYAVVVVDNLCNSKVKSIERVRDITGMAPVFVEADIRDRSSLNKIFSEHAIDAVIHFAGLKAVGESVTKPIEYYQNNLVGTLSLINAMKKAGVKNIVFSSSATVYVDPSSLPIKEEFPLSATNPYARCKLMIEEILIDVFASDSSWNTAILRYFNPVGAHKSGKIGEDPKDIPREHDGDTEDERFYRVERGYPGERKCYGHRHEVDRGDPNDWLGSPCASIDGGLQ